MSRTGILITLGVLVMLTPFSGLPGSLRSLALVICGTSVLLIGLSLRTKEVQAPPLTKAPEPESTPPPTFSSL